MDPAARAALRARLRACDGELLRALAARARCPPGPAPAWSGNDPRRPPPPLAEILHVLAPSGAAGDAGAADRRLVAALAARDILAGEMADAKARLHPEDFHAALAVGDQSGAIGRRAVTVEHLQYNPDGTMKPVVQTEAGVSVPPAR